MQSGLPPLPTGYEARMPRYAEEALLVSVGPDARGREAFLHPKAASAWQAMKTAAEKEQAVILVASAFRSVASQTEIVLSKLARGLAWEEILSRSAYPGYSEHHTGRAIDIVTPQYRDLVENFETTDEFSWLSGNAGRFGFFLSYPRQNPHGIVYEPWHWYWRSAE